MLKEILSVAEIMDSAYGNKTYSNAVNLPMAGFFNDPDNDALVYTATGLPVGISIDPASGLISGTLGSSASQSAPYSISVTVDDGVSSIVTTGFVMDVLNIAPVAASNQSISINEGDTLNYDASILFVDGDGDTLSYGATGLPQLCAGRGQGCGPGHQ